MKKYILSFVSLCSLNSYAVDQLTVPDFQKIDYLKYNSVKSTDLVFSDELQQEDIYKVTFEFETDNCASTGETVVCEWATDCEYFKVDTYENSIYPTEKKCTVDIEDVIGDILLIDDL